MTTIQLSQYGLSLSLSEQGGCVTSFTKDKQHILRPARSDRTPLDASAFPMVPFSGRIANGIFQVNGTSYKLPPNMPPEPHAIHGFGWQSIWQVVEQTGATAVLQHTSTDVWPFAYIAKQVFELLPTGLRLTLSVTNLGDEHMPAGLGWHPYFLREGATLTAGTEKIWISGDDMLPGPPVNVDPASDLRQERRVEDLELDNAFDVSSQHQLLAWPNMNVTMRADAVFEKLVVYVPRGENYFCVEPATHAPDAINSPLGDNVTGLRWLTQGETLSGIIHLDIH